MFRLRALVADHDEAWADSLLDVLANEGFECTWAQDGDEANVLIKTRQFELVVIDLFLPGRDGHALALEAIEAEVRPVIVIVSSVWSHRLAKDLLSRGVEDVVFKPTDVVTLAFKAKLLVRRMEQAAPPVSNSDVPGSTTHRTATRFMNTSRAVKSYRTSYDYSCNAEGIAKVLQGDPLLANEVLHVANGNLGPSDKKYMNLERSVIQVGVRRIGELALSMAVAQNLSSDFYQSESESNIIRAALQFATELQKQCPARLPISQQLSRKAMLSTSKSSKYFASFLSSLSTRKRKSSA